MNLDTLPNLTNRLYVLLLMTDLADPATTALVTALADAGACVEQVWINEGEWELNAAFHRAMGSNREVLLVVDAAVGLSLLDVQTLQQLALNEHRPVSAITGASRLSLDCERLPAGSSNLAVDKNASGYATRLRAMAVSLDSLIAMAAHLPVQADGVAVFFQAGLVDGKVLAPWEWFCRLWGGVSLCDRQLPVQTIVNQFPSPHLVERLMRYVPPAASEPPPSKQLVCERCNAPGCNPGCKNWHAPPPEGTP